jgi:hypothetical protein
VTAPRRPQSKQADHNKRKEDDGLKWQEVGAAEGSVVVGRCDMVAAQENEQDEAHHKQRADNHKALEQAT